MGISGDRSRLSVMKLRINVILSVLAKDLASNFAARSFASTLRMTKLPLTASRDDPLRHDEAAVLSQTLRRLRQRLHRGAEQQPPTRAIERQRADRFHSVDHSGTPLCTVERPPAVAQRETVAGISVGCRAPVLLA